MNIDTPKSIAYLPIRALVRSSRSDVTALLFRLTRVGVLGRRRFPKRARPDIEQSGSAQFVDVGQILEAVEAEMREKLRGRRPSQRPSRSLAPAGWAYPAGLDQPVERKAGQRDAADRLDLGARHRLVIGDDRQRLDR